MRTPAVVAVLAVAVGLGLLTGLFVLPARSAPAGGGPATTRPAGGPMTDRHLLTAVDFGAVGLTQRIEVRDRFGDGRYSNAACAGEKTLGQTLGGPGAYFRGLMTSKDAVPSDPTLALNAEDQVAREVAADAGSTAFAQNYTQRLLLEEVPCQTEPAGHWVYGPTHTVEVAANITASWMGSYDGDLNTAGTAPRDREPCGGIAILWSGSHYGILEVDACLDTAAITRIVRTAVTRL